MVATAGDFAAAGIDTDLVVGGAALTRRFTHGRIAPEYGGVCTYASDAMSGLDLIERLCDCRSEGGPCWRKSRRCASATRPRSGPGPGRRRRRQTAAPQLDRPHGRRRPPGLPAC